MQTTSPGWVIVSINHPTTGSTYMVESTFSRTRKQAIKEFCDGSELDWQYWRKNYNFRCVKAVQTIKIQL